MSGKVVKMERKADKEAQKKDLEQQLEAARKAQEDTMEGFKDHFINQAEVASEKYLTVNGYIQARKTLEDIECKIPEEKKQATPEMAADLALSMSLFIDSLVSSFKEASIQDYDNFFIGRIDTDFSRGEDLTLDYTATQLLKCNVLQNLSPNLDDAIHFYESTQEGIEKLEEELAKL